MRSLAPWLVILMFILSYVPSSMASGMPEPGTRIRVTGRVPERQRWMGPLVSVAHDTITMQADDLNGALVAIPMLHVERFEVSRGVHANMRRGALAGLAIGALAGAAAGYYAMRDSYSPGAGAAAGAALVGALGAVIGASNEARSPSEQWRTLPLEALRSAAWP